MTQQTLDNLHKAIALTILEVEHDEDHSLPADERIWLIDHYTKTLVRRAVKFVRGSKEHSDSPFFSIDSLRELINEHDDSDHYIGALARHLALAAARGTPAGNHAG